MLTINLGSNSQNQVIPNLFRDPTRKAPAAIDLFDGVLKQVQHDLGVLKTYEVLKTS